MTTSAGKTKLPADQHHRTRIETDLDATLFVEAGAGTGKTRELVERVLNLVESGIEMRSIAAITFTEAAAAELRGRLREALDKRARGDKKRPPSAAAAAGIDQVDEAAISTLHSFARRILSESPLEAGLPPVFEVRDEIQSGLAFEDWWAETLDQLLEDLDLQSSWYILLAIGLRADRVKLLAERLHEHWDRLEDRPGMPFDDGLSPDADALLTTAVDQAIAALRLAGEAAAGCRVDNDPLCALLRRMGRAAEESRGRSDIERLAAFAAFFDSGKPITGGRALKAAWATPEDITAVRNAACEAMDAARRVACNLAVRRLLAALRARVLEAADERRRLGELEFHDLLVLARRVLRTRPEVRERTRKRWARILIDEFQDTDPIQVELAALLATAAPADEVLVDHLPPLEPGRLFFVGDARQSIYRFRRADVALFQQVANSLLDEQSLVPLTQNFRSVPAVTDWVNQVIGPMLAKASTAEAGGYAPLVPFRKPLPGVKGPTVRMLGGPSADNLPAIRDREADEIAWVIKCAAGNDGVNTPWPVAAEGDDGVTRPATYNDIAVLLPTRTSLTHLERALEDQKIPYRVESASLVWSTQEVKDLVSCLRAIDDQGNEVAVVAALRSPVLGCSDEDLLEWAQANGRWRVQADTPPAIPDDHPVATGLAKLRALADERFWAGVSGVVERTARELGFFELALAHSRSRDSWRRLRHVIDEVRAFERGGGATLRQFLVWAAGQESEGARVKEAVLPESDHPAVRILTIHGAKGLEFPICVMSGLNSKPAGSPLARILFGPGGRAEARFNARALTSGFADLDAGEKDEEAAEDIRLLYVAATRAKDHLVVSVHHKAETATYAADQTHARKLLDAAQPFENELWVRMPPELHLASMPTEPTPPSGDLAAERRAWAAEREDLIERVRRSPVRSATDMKKAADEAIERQPWQRGRGATAVGRAVHATLQTVDLATGDRLEETASAQAAAEGVPQRAAEIEARVRAALASPVAAEASKNRHWRELYVGAPVDDFTIEGYIDLLYETDEGLVLVDWKTDAIDPRTEQAEAISRYGEQMKAYAKVLEVTLGRKVARAELVFLSEREAVNVEVGVTG